MQSHRGRVWQWIAGEQGKVARVPSCARCPYGIREEDGNRYLAASVVSPLISRYGSSFLNVLYPKPFTCRRSATRLKPPFFARQATTRSALDGPTVGRSWSCSSLAVLRLSLPLSCLWPDFFAGASSTS